MGKVDNTQSKVYDAGGPYVSNYTNSGLSTQKTLESVKSGRVNGNDS